MSRYDELQKAAAYAAQDTIKFADEDEEMRALQQFHEEVDPETVLALIAENERLRNLPIRNALLRDREKLIDQRNELKAEVAGLKTGYEAYERVNAELKAENEALRKDAERLQSATAFVQKLCDSAGKQPSVATGYLHDILSAMGKEEQS